MVAKVKFWFGKDKKIFNTKKYDVEFRDNYAYISEKEKKNSNKRSKKKIEDVM